MKYINLLKENTNNLNSAVDFIYKTFYADFFKRLNNAKTGWDIPSLPASKMITSASLAKLSKNKLVQKLNKINPVDILIEMPGHGNAYSPRATTIYIKLSSFYKFVESFAAGFDLENSKFKKTVDYFTARIYRKNQIEFKEDFLGNKIKNSIAHELNHWADDTLHNRHIFKRLNHASELNQPIVPDGTSVATTDFEMDSQIHQIKQMKRTISKKLWDTMTFDEMIKHDNSLSRAIIPSLSIREYVVWRKKILKRLARENLLGKNMIHK